jgi:hypothetical protein
MTVNDLLTNVNTFIGDTSNDRISATDRYQALTEATAWLLEELGNEHMVDRAEIEFLPTVLWYKMDNLTPYLLTAGQLRFKEDDESNEDFTRVEARDLATMTQNRNAYAVERFNGDTYIGIVIPNKTDYPYTDLIPLSASDDLTYTGVNASNIYKETNAVRFDMTGTGVTQTGLTTVTEEINLTNYVGTGVLIFEVEIPDMTDVNSVSIKFGDDLSTDYFLGTVTQDVNGNPLAVGVNTIKVHWRDLTPVGTPDSAAVTKWGWYVNHDNTKPAVDGFRLSDMRIAKPIYLNFKYIFYRVGKNSGGTDITEFTAGTDVPFFGDRYPQYKFAVAHKAAGILFRSLQLIVNARSEDAEAIRALDRYRKNFSGERDMSNSTFKVAGVSFRNRRIIRRR